MKSACLLAKTPEFFADFAHYLKSLPGDYQEHINSVKLTLDSNSYFMFYNLLDDGFYEAYEMPPDAISEGYRYSFLVECRSEVDFCRIVGSSPPNLDLLVCDSNGVLYRPNELSPNSIIL